MSKDIRHLARVWFEEVWNKQRTDAIDELWDPNCVAHGLGAGGADVSGTQAFKELHRAYLGAFPDLKVHVEDVITEGDRTAIRFTCTGTHQGEMFGVAATGREARFTGISIARWKDGRIVEGWNNIDFHAMLQQIT
jgi:steroid delta-isomerase-like uncharacterized protein